MDFWLVDRQNYDIRIFFVNNNRTSETLLPIVVENVFTYINSLNSNEDGDNEFSATRIYDEYVGSSIEDYYTFMEKNDDFIKEFKEEIENEEQEITMKNSQADKIEEKSQEIWCRFNAERNTRFKIKNKWV